MKRIVTLTLDGDIPGINVTTHAEVRALQNQEMSVVGFKRGYNGILTHGWGSKDDYGLLTATNVSNRISCLGNPSVADHVLAPGRLRGVDAKQKQQCHDHKVVWSGSDPGAICRYAEEHSRSVYRRCRAGRHESCDYPQLKQLTW